MKTVALDLDSTIAATSEVMFDLINGPEHDYSYDDIETWSWGIEEFGHHAFLNGCWHAWTLRPLEVPPTEENIVQKVQSIKNTYGSVDIVTAHPPNLEGVTEGKQKWADHHGIPYDSFVVVGMDETKAEYGYDVYIDDKPTLPKTVNDMNPGAKVYLYDRKYNRGAPGEYERVTSLSSVGRNAVDPPVTRA